MVSNSSGGSKYFKPMEKHALVICEQNYDEDLENQPKGPLGETLGNRTTIDARRMENFLLSCNFKVKFLLDPTIENLKHRFQRLNQTGLRLSHEASRAEKNEVKGMLLFVFVVGHGVTHKNQQCLRLAGQPDNKRNPYPIEKKLQ